MTSQQLRQRRAALGLTQLELSEALGVHVNTLARWERGELTIERPVMLDLALEALEARKQEGH